MILNTNFLNVDFGYDVWSAFNLLKMTQNYVDDVKLLFSQGLVDEEYPLERACVQLPNGWYGINTILNDMCKELSDFGYEEVMVPSVSVNTVFNGIPEEFLEDSIKTALPVTHTGLHKLEEPLLMSRRPDLILPIIEKNFLRTYRNLPVRRIIGGFRYNLQMDVEHYPLITDNEITTKDFVGIFFTEKEYNNEIQEILKIFTKLIDEKCKIKYFVVSRPNKIIFCTPLSNGSILEFAILYLFGQKLSEGVDLKVLSPSNTQFAPFIFNFSIN